MAPDINSLSTQSSRPIPTTNPNPQSQQASPSRSRRTSSSVMGPPPLPMHSSLPNSPRPPNSAMMENSATLAGPIRHPRPLTAAELHLELEKEQESIVNRLTRELSALRAQTASVASTTSSASDLFATSQGVPEYNYPYVPGTGATIIPTAARRHRSSSNLSARSARSARDNTLGITPAARDVAATSVSGVAAPREPYSHQASSRPSLEITRPSVSRQNSMTGTSERASAYRSSAATSPYAGAPTGSYGHSHRASVGSFSAAGVEARSPSFGTASAAARYEEAAMQRQELDAVKKENETLKQRIRELERALAQGNQAAGPRSRDNSQSASAGATSS